MRGILSGFGVLVLLLTGAIAAWTGSSALDRWDLERNGRDEYAVVQAKHPAHPRPCQAVDRGPGRRGTCGASVTFLLAEGPYRVERRLERRQFADGYLVFTDEQYERLREGHAVRVVRSPRRGTGGRVMLAENMGWSEPLAGVAMTAGGALATVMAFLAARRFPAARPNGSMATTLTRGAAAWLLGRIAARPSARAECAAAERVLRAALVEAEAAPSDANTASRIWGEIAQGVVREQRRQRRRSRP